jgi:hypothetical protein
LINGKQRKLVKEERIINHFSPTTGSRNAPDKLLVTKAKLLIEHNKAKEVASSPFIELRAIKSISIRKINIPTRLKTIS